MTVLGGWGWSLDGHVWGLWWPFGYAFGRPRRAVAKVAGVAPAPPRGAAFGVLVCWCEAKVRRRTLEKATSGFLRQGQFLISHALNSHRSIKFSSQLRAAPTESLLFGAVVQNGGFPADTIASRYTNVHAHPMSRAGWICLRVQSGTVDRAACVTIRHR